MNLRPDHYHAFALRVAEKLLIMLLYALLQKNHTPNDVTDFKLMVDDVKVSTARIHKDFINW